MFTLINNAVLTTRMAGHTIRYLGSGRWHRAAGPIPDKACQVPADFFGICVANAPDSSSDNYVIARLHELGIRQVRLDFTYADRDAFTERFLDRLLNERFQVCLHLVQPLEDARIMAESADATERWRSFIGEMLDNYGSRLALIEIGSTCNRRKWSGYSPAAFFAAWQIAWEEARGRNLAIAGPNVTDFEPIYNAGWLGEMQRSGISPAVHTDNLFVERATEPEAFDHKIGGARLAGALRFNLVRKARLLQDIGAWAGAPIFMCAHVAWSLRRIARFLEDTEGKQADYLARYACLAAASGALARVYWGPLIGQREGLIDDGTSEYPEIPHVTYYEQARGEIKNYRLRPAYRTFQTVNRLLSGATFKRCLASGKGLEMLEFVLNAECRIQNAEDGGRKTDDGRRTTDDGKEAEKQTPTIQLTTGEQALVRHAADPTSNAEPRTKNSYIPSAQFRTTVGGNLQSKIENRKSKILHAVWTTDGNGASLDSCYPPELLGRAEIYSRDGERLEHAPRMVSESPVFLVWTDDGRQTTDDRTEQQTSNIEHRTPNIECRTTDDGRRTATSSLQPSAYSPQPSILKGFRFARLSGWDFDIVRAENNAHGLGGVYLADNGKERVDIQALTALCKENAECRMQNAECSEDGRRTAADVTEADKRTSNIELATGKQAPVRHAADPTSNAEPRTKNSYLPSAQFGTTEGGNFQSKIENRKSEILRAARNFVWSTNAPWKTDLTIVIKAFKPRPIIRRILEWGKPNKAVRSWNGSQELLRRGLFTPTPIACLSPAKTALRGLSYYICEAFAPAWSARDAFTAFSSGAAAFQGRPAKDLYEVIAVFMQKMHTRGVYFRDLSAGNLLFKQTPSGELEFALIDTARARFYRHSLGLRLRLCDLMRICHPLDWPSRHIFVDKYMAHSGRRFSWWMKFPFWYYDWKHRIKNALKRKRRQARSTKTS